MARPVEEACALQRKKPGGRLDRQDRSETAEREEQIKSVGTAAKSITDPPSSKKQKKGAFGKGTIGWRIYALTEQ